MQCFYAPGATWRDTRPVEGKCGEYCAVLREAFDGRLHYAATTVRRRELARTLDFLGALAVFTRHR